MYRSFLLIFSIWFVFGHLFFICSESFSLLGIIPYAKRLISFNLLLFLFYGLRFRIAFSQLFICLLNTSLCCSCQLLVFRLYCFLLLFQFFHHSSFFLLSFYFWCTCLLFNCSSMYKCLKNFNFFRHCIWLSDLFLLDSFPYSLILPTL